MIDWAETLSYDRASHPDRGRGATIVLFDSGIDAGRPLPPNIHNLIGLQPSAEARANRHAERIAMLTSGYLGIAPGATVYSAHRGPPFPDEFADLLEDAGVDVDIVGFPFSAPENAQLALVGGNALVSDFERTEGALMVASSGHDGNNAVRFPGSCNAALTVGMMEPGGGIHPRTGQDERMAKPDVLVADAEYATQFIDGAHAVIDGSSAAVAIVCGSAALWVDEFRRKRWPLTPWALRSAMMAGCVRGADAQAHWRQLSLAWTGANAGLDMFAGSTRFSREWIVSITGPAGDATLGIGLRIAPSSGLWLPRDLETALYDYETGVGDRLGALHNHGAFDGLQSGKTYLLRLDDRASEFALTLVGSNGTAIQARPMPQPVIGEQHRQVIVGVSASHDGSACVLINGVIKHAIQLERITRKKHDGHPYLSHDEAIDYCLRAAGLDRQDVDRYAFNAQPLYPGQVGLSTPIAATEFSCFSPFAANVVHVSHHLCHAFSARILATEPDCSILVVDGSGGSVYCADDHILSGPELKNYLTAGSQETDTLPDLHVLSLYRFDKDGFELLLRETAPSFNVRHGSSSIGETYAAVAQYIFGSWHASGKVMGLASYAMPRGSLLHSSSPDGLTRFRADWKLDYNQSGGDPVLDHSVLAATVQNDLETCLLDRIEAAARLAPLNRLYYAGGVALNCKANQLIEHHNAVTELNVFPASNDAGIALGAAAAAYYESSGKMLTVGTDYHEYLGYPYSDADIRLAIREYRQFLSIEPYDCATVADHLNGGQIIGWFDGGSEFGPRALGHRSILADPRSAVIRDRINRDVKYREEFRPFAPITLQEEASNWFETGKPYPFMTQTVNVLPAARGELAAVTHVDGSARLQTICDALNPKIAALLRAFKTLNGLAVLINTSLNLRGQPIVETPLQAVEFLLCSGLDRLVIGDYVLSCNAPLAATDPLDLLPSLAPDVELMAKHRGTKGKRYLLRSVQRNMAYELPVSVFSLLDYAMTNQVTLKQALQPTGLAADDAPLLFLTALFAEKLIHASFVDNKS